MLAERTHLYSLWCVVLAGLLCWPAGDLLAQRDTTSRRREPYGDALSRPDSESPLKLDNPKNVKVTYELSEDGQGYYIYERVAGRDVRPPSYISREEYERITARRESRDYLRDKSRGEYAGSGKLLAPALKVNSKLFESIFGSNKVDIKPNVSVLLDFALRRNVMKNPALTQRQQRNTSFNFQQQIQMDVVGSIGEKLKLRVSYDTQASFAFENQFKINYVGDEDDIIKGIEAGNVSLPLNGTLITGGQNLWGIKVATQFGPVFVTAIASQSRGQRQSITVSGGSTQTPIEIRAGDYDQNRHFFLSHHFRARYEEALRNLPIITSEFVINRVEVWVTNRSSQSTTGNRNIIGLIDLGENDPERGGVLFNPDRVQINPGPERRFPQNQANTLYEQVSRTPGIRARNTAIQALQNLGYESGSDFEIFENLRQLMPSDYTVNTQLGYISLNQRLNPNDVLFVAYEYTVNGQVQPLRVGEFSNEQTADANGTNTLILKMIKPSGTRTGPSPINPNVRPFPTWDLMMKNVYSIGTGAMRDDKLDLQLIYESTDGSGDINFLPTSGVKNTPLLQVFRLDRLTNNSEFGPDNKFDFIPGATVIPQKSLIVFPVLEPFGSYLYRRFAETAENPLQAREDSARYAYPMLYRYTQADAVNYFPQYNRFKFRGMTAGAAGSEIYLNSVQVAPGSVVVTAGGRALIEGQDYTVDYGIGKVTIMNPAILSTGQEIKVSFESSTLFGIDQKSLVGARVDYKFHRDIILGATILHLNERPLINKILIGDEPVSNTIWGLDVGFRKESRFLTTLLDKLPFYSTNVMSEISVNAEFAHLIPGLPRQVKTARENGIAYIDDFEGTRAFIDLTSQQFWKLASLPLNPEIRRPLGAYANRELHPRGEGYTRARLAWYLVDPIFYDQPQLFGYNEQSPTLNSPYTRRVGPAEIFPNRTLAPGTNLLATFDVHYDPTQRGPYNYLADPLRVSPDGRLSRPLENWAGIMRRTTGNTDFEAANIEFIEFWLMDPFIENPNHSGVELYFNLGRVSEDVLPDGDRQYENGLPTNANDNANGANTRETAWGRVPIIQTPTTAFDNNPEARQFQDVGLDGLRSEDERAFFADYLERLRAFLNPEALAVAEADPSTDDYVFFRDPPNGSDLLERYYNFNGTEGNSPLNTQGQQFSRMATPFPDIEDLNADNTLSVTNAYFEYRIPITPRDLEIGRNFIVDKRDTLVRLPRDPAGSPTGVSRWYLFRIPLNKGVPVGDIQDLKAVDFIRMYVKGAQEPVTLRFGKMELVSTQWRRFIAPPRFGENGEVIGGTDPGAVDPNAPAFEIGTVNVEENGQKQPFAYVIPPEIQRQEVPGSAIRGILQNEQSLVMRVNNLPDGGEEGAFRVLRFDLRNYQRFKMWVHAESPPPGTAPCTTEPEAFVFVRIGTDMTNNYYEYQMPVRRSDPAGGNDPFNVWANEVDFALEELQRIKAERNARGGNFDAIYPPDPAARFRIRGNPRLDAVQAVMVGIRNPRLPNEPTRDPLCLEVWVNEIRVTDFDQTNAWAANARVNLKLADLANVSLSGTRRTPRFGSLEEKLTLRSQEDITNYDVALNLQAGKLLPPVLRLEIPVFVTYGERTVVPRFDPLDPDILLTTAEEQALRPGEKRRTSVDYSRVYSYSFTNVRRLRGEGQTESRPWDLENFAFTYGYNDRFRRSAQLEYHIIQQWQGSIGYGFVIQQPPVIQPFRSLKPALLKPISEINFSPLPRQVTVRLDGNRHYETQRLRSVANNITIPATYNKNFLLTRTYNLQWEPMRSIRINYNAVNVARVDEPFGDSLVDNRGNRLRDNFWFVGEDTSRLKFNRFNLGRTINFNQSIDASYMLPLRILKPLDWVNASINYRAAFQWQSAQIQNFDLGHNIQNNRTINLNLQLAMNTFYRKFPVIEKIKKPIPKKSVISLADSTRKEGDDLEVFVKRVGKTFAGFLFSVQTVDFQYGITQGTALYGYMPRTDNFGMDWNYGDRFSGARSDAPGWGFILGEQPLVDNPERWFSNAADKGWFARDGRMTRPYAVNDGRNLNVRAMLEPLKDFRIDVTAQRTMNRTYEGTFIFDDDTREFNYALRNETGSFTMSTFTLGSAFGGTRGAVRAFERFSSNRRIVSERLRNANPEYGEGEGFRAAVVRSELPGVDGYWNGYLGSQQDVLISSFLSAYGPGSADKIPLTPFLNIPLPNWNVTYNGLTNIDFFKERFRTVTLRHGYTSTYNTAYLLNLNALDPDGNGFSTVSLIRDTTSWLLGGQRGVDTLSARDYQSVYNIQSITINENFAPLLGINIAWKNDINTAIDFKRRRMVALNVGAMQVNEMRSTDITVNISWRRDKGLDPITLFGKSFELKNTITYRFEVTVRNSRTENRYLDATRPPEPTAGNLNMTFKPSVDYLVNNQLTVRVYIEHTRNNPVLSTAFPTRFTAYGVQVQFRL